jgi:hypothetical protein
MKGHAVKSMLALTSLCCAFVFTAAHAGPVQEFETQLRGSYGSYRVALFATNSGDAAKSAQALDGFGKSWSGVVAGYAEAPPPQYEADAKWAQTMTAVQATIEAARSQIAAGDLPAAHLTLEAVRSEFGDLHARNGLSGFSDRMNDYHAEMEEILALDLAATDAVTLAQHAGILGYLAAKIEHQPAPEAAGNAEYDSLQQPFLDSVKAFDTAVRSGDAAAIATAAAGLKVPYSKFFLKFG